MNGIAVITVRQVRVTSILEAVSALEVVSVKVWVSVSGGPFDSGEIYQFMGI